MSHVAHGRGRLTDADRDRIFALAEQKFSAGRIAQLLKRHQSTVLWFMYCNGLQAPRPNAKPIVYTRGDGVVVHRFTDAEDVFIEAMRTQGMKPDEIAALAAARFGTQRKHHSIRCRLKMLASRELVEELT